MTLLPNHTAGLSGAKEVAGKKVRSRYRQLWLHSVLFTALLAIGPLTILTCHNYYQYQKTFKAKLIQPISRFVSNTQQFMDFFLEERKAVLTLTINENSYEDLTDPEKLNSIFMNMQNSFEGFVDLSVLEPNGRQRTYAGPEAPNGRNDKTQDWFGAVCNNGICISDVFLDFRNLSRFVIAVRKDHRERGGFYILKATMDAQVLDRYLAAFNIGSSSDVFLINHRGLLQTQSRFGGKVLQRCPVALPPVSSHAKVQKVTDEAGERRTIGYAYIEQSPFILVALTSPKDIAGKWPHLGITMFLLLGGGIILILGGTFGSATYLVKRIRRADRELAEALNTAQHTNRLASIGRLAAGVAHEINNPLAIINENAGLMQDLIAIEGASLEKDRLSSIAGTILKSVKRCSIITHGLLGFGKKMDSTIECVNLERLLREVLRFESRVSGYRNIAVSVNIPKNLPAIESDRGQLQQVFLNLLSNAYDAVDDEGEITISMQLRNENVITVMISDNGDGIPEDNIKRIFEPFFTTKLKYGTGLGLSITYSIVRKLGGRVTVKSKLGVGTCFTVGLPVKMQEKD